MTLSLIRASALNKLKQPGEHSTQPNTCSVAFCSQWAMAYSNFWYQIMGPKDRYIHHQRSSGGLRVMVKVKVKVSH